MDFKQLVMHDVDEKYQEMANGTTEKPLLKTPIVISNNTYEKKRNTYYKRLDSEKIDFNKAIVKIKNAQTTRLRDEEKKREEKERKRVNRRAATKKFAKVFLTLVIVVGALSALMGFVIWPKVIYPNMDANGLYTPELLQTYQYTEKYNTNIFTFTECSADGNVSAIWERYGSSQLESWIFTGQIKRKRNNGSVTIEWMSKEKLFSDDESLSDSMNITEFHKGDFSQFKMDSGSFGSSSKTYTTNIDDKYWISTVDDLRKLNDSKEVYYLKNDIDLKGIQWTPIDGFAGTLVGCGHKISHLTIHSDSSNVGFFSTLSGTVLNITFENVDISVSNGNNIGVLCGKMEDHGNVIGISVSGSVTALSSDNVGGMVGEWDSKYIPPSFAGLVNSAIVCGKNNVGGVVGHLSRGIAPDMQLEKITNKGDVKGSGDNVGGVFGYLWIYADVYIDGLQNFGKIEGNSNVGGVIGYAYSGGWDSYIQNSTTTFGKLIGEVKGLDVK